MDIKIEVPGIKNSEKTADHARKRLHKKYSAYPFIPSLDAKIEHKKDKYVVSLHTKPEKGKMIFAQGKDAKINKALNAAIKKLNQQIEKYKQKHYQSANRIAPESLLE